MKIFTIGHSNDSLEYFLELIQRNGIDTVVDVRRIPYSRYASQFNKKNLATYLGHHKISYVFMGDTLGGKITDQNLLNERGKIDYTKVVRSRRFLQGISQLENILQKGSIVTLMCAEKDPLRCHRFFLISRFLASKDYDILHIIGEKVFEHRELERKLNGRLFAHFKPVSHAD